MNSAHRALRAATADAHVRVDALFGGFDLATRQGYAAFLSAQAAALLPLEAALDAGGARHVTEDWPQRRRRAALLADLAELGAEPAEPPAPVLVGIPAAAGTLYVVEGSRLGGRVIARSLPADAPRRFLDTDQLSGNWRKLLDRLELILYQPAALHAATAAALDAFAAFERAGRSWLAKG